MPIFISYSHSDSEFALRLAEQLVIHKAQVWIDKWELKVGDSLIDRIQSALEDASALLVILSKSSVESEWCRTELSSGLIRELEEKKVIVLPVVIDDCEIPLLLRRKVFADFRTNFDHGLGELLPAIASISSGTRGRYEEPKWYMDWSIDWSLLNGSYCVEINVLEVTKDYPYSCLVNIQIIGNEFATKRYKRFLELNLDWFQAAATTYAIAAHPNINDLRVLLRGNKPQINKFFFKDSRTPLLFTIIVQSRLMGEDTGHDTLLDIGKQIKNISNDQQRVFRKLSPFELEQVKKIQEEFI